MHIRFAVLGLALGITAGAAQTPSPSTVQPSQWFALDEKNMTFITGDTWSSKGVTYRLYGVQSCLRGTYFTNLYGLKRDCGEASMAMTIAMIRDLKPVCYTAVQTQDASTQFVVCMATFTTGPNAGSRIDFATALITYGFAFAAVSADGKAVHAPYIVAQALAQKKHSGLWQFSDLPDPNALILQTLRPRTAITPTPSVQRDPQSPLK